MATGEESGKVLQTTVRVELPRGEGKPTSVVAARRIKRTDLLEAMQVTKPRDDDPESQMALGVLLNRMRIVGAEALTDCDTGEDVPFASARMAGVERAVCAKAVINALSDADLSLIEAMCPLMPAAMSEKKKGN